MFKKLKFARGNAKLGKHTAIFSLPAGYTCPGANLCLSRSHKTTGKLTDGPQTQFRCYAATGENLFKNIRISRWRNFETLKKAATVKAMADTIHKSMIRKGISLCRIHGSGDFFSQDYFDAWLMVAQRNPEIIFYGYTKALLFWISRLKRMPDNFRLVASIGGKFDSLIPKFKLRTAKVVFSEKEAADLGLPIDHDDTHMWNSTGDFALLLHGTQPKGSAAGKVLYALRQLGKGGYKSDYFAHYFKDKK